MSVCDVSPFASCQCCEAFVFSFLLVHVSSFSVSYLNTWGGGLLALDGSSIFDIWETFLEYLCHFMFLHEVGFIFHILLPFSIFCFWVKIISCWEKDQVPARGGSCLSERFHKYNSWPEHRTERLKPRWVSGEWDPRSAAQVCITLALYLNLDLTSEPQRWTWGRVVTGPHWINLFFFFWNIILLYLK